MATSSLRRQAQVRSPAARPEVVRMRGNVETRLRKLAEGVADATLLACAEARPPRPDRITSCRFRSKRYCPRWRKAPSASRPARTTRRWPTLLAPAQRPATAAGRDDRARIPGAVSRDRAAYRSRRLWRARRRRTAFRGRILTPRRPPSRTPHARGPTAGCRASLAEEAAPRSLLAGRAQAPHFLRRGCVERHAPAGHPSRTRCPEAAGRAGGARPRGHRRAAAQRLVRGSRADRPRRRAGVHRDQPQWRAAPCASSPAAGTRRDTLPCSRSGGATAHEGAHARFRDRGHRCRHGRRSS